MGSQNLLHPNLVYLQWGSLSKMEETVFVGIMSPFLETLYMINPCRNVGKICILLSWYCSKFFLSTDDLFSYTKLPPNVKQCFDEDPLRTLLWKIYFLRVGDAIQRSIQTFIQLHYFVMNP